MSRVTETRGSRARCTSSSCDNPSVQIIQRLGHALVVFALGAAVLHAQTPSTPQPPDPAADALRAGQQLMRDGKADEALAAYLQAAEKFPTSVSVRIRVGVQHDLMGRYAEARTHFTKALAMDLTPALEAQALRSMAMAYAFESNCKDAIP